MITPQLIKLVEDSEGFKENPYLDDSKIWTYGFGFIYTPQGERVTENTPPITRENAEMYLTRLIGEDQNFVNGILPNLNQNRKDSLTDFCYNFSPYYLKTSTLLKLILANPEDPAIRAEFDKWVHVAGGAIDPGLVTRRKNEADLYFTPIPAV